MADRETIITALLALLQGAYAWKTTGRRVKTFDQVPHRLRPALYLTEHGESWAGSSESLRMRTLQAMAVIYTDTRDEAAIGGTELNQIMEALEAALKPASGADLATGKQTLGGLVSHCFIEGDVFKDPGDIDKDGLLVVPINILVP